MTIQPTNSNILEPNPPKNSFVVGDWNDAKKFYAAVPFGNKLAILHQADIIKICQTEKSARNFIENHRKGKSTAKLPLD
mgnify:CR=1 FL=1|jgi:hypothetical protein